MKKIMIFSLLLLFTNLALPQSSTSWKNYSSFNKVNKIAKIEGGFWAATTGGVYKYTDKDSTYFTLSKSDGLFEQNSSCIELDQKGNIWIGGTSGSITVYNPTLGSTKKILDIYNSSFSQKKINNIMVKGDTAFIATECGLSLINTNTFLFIDSYLKFGSFNINTPVNSIFIDKKLMVATASGLAIPKDGVTNLNSPDSWQTSSIATQPVKSIIKFGNTILFLTPERIYQQSGNTFIPFLNNEYGIVDLKEFNGKLYLLTQNQLKVYSNSNISTVFTYTKADFYNLSIISDNQFYVATSKGTLKFNNNLLSMLAPNSPITNTIMNIAVDKNNNLWCATGRDGFGVGILKFDQKNWSIYDQTKIPSIKNNDFHNVYADDDSLTYFMSWGSGFTVHGNNKFTTYNAQNTPLIGTPGTSEDLKFIAITGIKKDNNKNLWVLNYFPADNMPLNVLTKDGKWIKYKMPGFEKQMLSSYLAIDKLGRKWFATRSSNIPVYNNLLYFDDKGTLENTLDDTATEIPLDNINSIISDLYGDIWIASDGVYNLDAQLKIVDPTRGRAMPKQIVNAITVDPINQKWVGTNNGIYVLSPDGVSQIAHYTSENSPLPSNTIVSLFFNQNTGILYISTDLGITTYSSSSAKPLISFEKLNIYPNPVLIDGNSPVSIKISGLIRDCSIRILNSSGAHVKTFIANGGGIGIWDGKDSKGNFVNSGIYVIIAYDREATNVITGKVAIIRK